MACWVCWSGSRTSRPTGSQTSPMGGSHAEFALASLFQLAAEQARAQPVQLRLAHRPHDPEEKLIGVLSGIVDPLFVDDQRLGQGADLEQAMPIAAGACQPRGLQAEDGPRLAQPDQRDEPAEALPVRGRCAGDPLIQIDHLDRLLWPSQLACPAREVVLAGGAGRVLADLERGGLSDVDHRGAVAVIAPDLLRGEGREHGGASWVTGPSGVLTTFDARDAISSMARAWLSAASAAQTWPGETTGSTEDRNALIKRCPLARRHGMSCRQGACYCGLFDSAREGFWCSISERAV